MKMSHKCGGWNNGTGGYRAGCKGCQAKAKKYRDNRDPTVADRTRTYHRERNRKTRQRRKRFIQLIKSAIGCQQCGWNGHPAALQFDHIHEKKSFSLANITTRSLTIVMNEIEKCQVLCANCHMVKSHG